VRDWCVIAVGGRRKDGFVDIIDVEMTRKPPEEQIALLLDMLQRWSVRRVFVEENMFKNLYAPSINRLARERGIYPGVHEITNTTNKISRIQGIQPILHNGTVRFNRTFIDHKREFLAQFDEFPAQFDDGPDCVEMLVRGLEINRIGSAPQGFSTPGSYWRGRP